MSQATCPMCGNKWQKAIYCGFPLRICVDHSCACAKGWPATWLMEHLPLSQYEEENGGWMLVPYEGSYWSGLKAWWKATGNPNED